MDEIPQLLSTHLVTDGVDVESVKVEPDWFGYLSIVVRYWMSIEVSDSEWNRTLLTVVKDSAPYFNKFSVLQRLMISISISDDQVSDTQQWYSRDDLIAWQRGMIDDETILDHSTSYW